MRYLIEYLVEDRLFSPPLIRDDQSAVDHCTWNTNAVLRTQSLPSRLHSLPKAPGEDCRDDTSAIRQHLLEQSTSIHTRSVDEGQGQFEQHFHFGKHIKPGEQGSPRNPLVLCTQFLCNGIERIRVAKKKCSWNMRLIKAQLSLHIRYALKR